MKKGNVQEEDGVGYEVYSGERKGVQENDVLKLHILEMLCLLSLLDSNLIVCKSLRGVLFPFGRINPSHVNPSYE